MAMSACSVAHCEVYIIDARPEDYRHVLSAFERDSVTFQFAATLEEAMRLRAEPDAVWLINVRQPDGAGIELGRQLRDRGAPQVFVVADSPSSLDEIAAREVGMGWCGVKPISAGWLRLAIRSQKPRLDKVAV